MDLSFRPFLPERELTVTPGDFAALVATVAQAGGSATARVQLILDVPAADADRFAPLDGSFNAAVAAALTRWRGG